MTLAEPAKGERRVEDLPVHRFPGRDGLGLAYRELGSGRPIVLLHGFTGTGWQWVRHGPASAIAGLGYRVILPDLRGHGDSARPHDPASYPPDVLADDGLALIDWLGLDDYDLGGYSLGARVVLRMLVRGAQPARAIVAGQGLDAIDQSTSRTGRYHRLLTAIIDGERFEPGSRGEQTARWIEQSGADPRALRSVLDTHVATPAAALGQVKAPTLVAVGDQDDAHASADALAAALPSAHFTRVPGNHYSALGSPALAAAIIAFLNGQ
jgi:pimeloyl-ACP methyl ester carboxylesterase